MKKIAWSLAVLVMLGLILAGCARKTEEVSKPEIISEEEKPAEEDEEIKLLLEFADPYKLRVLAYDPPDIHTQINWQWALYEPTIDGYKRVVSRSLTEDVIKSTSLYYNIYRTYTYTPPKNKPLMAGHNYYIELYQEGIDWQFSITNPFTWIDPITKFSYYARTYFIIEADHPNKGGPIKINVLGGSPDGQNLTMAQMRDDPTKGIPLVIIQEEESFLTFVLRKLIDLLKRNN